MKRLLFGWKIWLLVILALTNFLSYQYGRKLIPADTGVQARSEKEEEEFEDEDIIIIVARPEGKSEGDESDEQFFRSHIAPKATPYMVLGKGGFLGYRGQMFSRKPLDESKRLAVGLLR
jgi:hypothetical protein